VKAGDLCIKMHELIPVIYAQLMVLFITCHLFQGTSCQLNSVHFSGK